RRSPICKTVIQTTIDTTPLRIYLLIVTWIRKGRRGDSTASRIDSAMDIYTRFLYGAAYLNTLLSRLKSNIFLFFISSVIDILVVIVPWLGQIAKLQTRELKIEKFFQMLLSDNSCIKSGHL